VIRFHTRYVREDKPGYCVRQITKTIDKLGGLKSDGIVPRKFKQLSEGTEQQLTLFEQSPSYEVEDDPFDE
jgi:hypothetical protein